MNDDKYWCLDTKIHDQIPKNYSELIELSEKREIGSDGNFNKSFIIANDIIKQTGLIKNEKSQNNLIAAAVCRDIGKLYVDEEILNSEDIFDSDDPRWEKIKNHPIRSVELLEQAAGYFSPDVLYIVKYHHPWYYKETQGGYLINSDWNELILSYEIVSIIDAYIGLRANRTRRQKRNHYNHEEIIDKLQNDTRFSSSLIIILNPILEVSYQNATIRT